jgi:hypothetical protein
LNVKTKVESEEVPVRGWLLSHCSELDEPDRGLGVTDQTVEASTLIGVGVVVRGILFCAPL